MWTRRPWRRPPQPSWSRRFTPPVFSARNRRRSSAWHRRWSSGITARCRPIWTRSSSCQASAARRRTSCLGTRWACLDCRSIGTCCASPTGSGSPNPTILSSSSSSCAAPCRRNDGRVRRTRSSCTAGVSAGRNRGATFAPCRMRVTTSTPPKPRRLGRGARRRARQRQNLPVERRAFDALVADALAGIPSQFREALANLAISVESEPAPSLLREMEIEPPDTLLGLYQGTPLTERGSTYGNTLPDRILLFQGPLERASEDEDDLIVAIGETLIHEIGHYFGLSEEEIEDIEENYWKDIDEA